ncbi:MAG: Ldh family oxidoreductase [Candidatus Aminicenantes bacterium]|nr:Ldh family oxidoreductase [Candidatus Aminicenantes bacterium]
MKEGKTIIQEKALFYFCFQVFEKMGVSPEDARTTTDVLVQANLRGIDSHGVARLIRYVKGLQEGVMVARPEEKVIVETPTTVTIDAGAGLGQPVSYRAMEMAIKKAKKYGCGFATVGNSNHFGIAGYYAMMALEHDMIGICTTNAAVLVVPTFSRDAMYGTNPIALAVPAGEERPWIMDMATSTVPRGKLEVYNRQEKPLPLGWATDEQGLPTTDASRVLDNFVNRAGGGLLPLGGAGEELRGYKGYGIGILVEILSSVLSGAAYLTAVYPKDSNGKPLPANLGHFFGAWRLDAFREPTQFEADMDKLIRHLKGGQRAEGASRIFVHGEKEFEEVDRRRKQGIPLSGKVEASLKEIASELGVAYNL